MVGPRRVGPRTQKSGAPKGGAEKWGPEGWGPKPRKVGPRRVGPRRVRRQKSGAPKGGATKGGAPEGGGSKFRAFFSSPAPIFALSVSLWGSSRGFWWCLEVPGLKCARLEFLGCCVKPRRPEVEDSVQLRMQHHERVFPFTYLSPCHKELNLLETMKTNSRSLIETPTN